MLPFKLCILILSSFVFVLILGQSDQNITEEGKASRENNMTVNTNMTVSTSTRKPDKPRNCHKNRDSMNTANADTYKAINDELSELYDNLVKDAAYEENCNFSITITNGNSTTEEENEESLVHQLEQFELEIENYRRGLWGYCAKEGANHLLGQIKKMKDYLILEKTKNHPVKICDRSKLLKCHERYKKCQCLLDNRNYRSIVTHYWNKAEAKDDQRKDIGANKCILASGSDCPINSNVLCHPGTSCRVKETQTPCTTTNLQKYFDGSISTVGAGGSSSNNSSSLSRRKREAKEEEAEHSTYSIMNRDFYPSIYCQCMGYVRKTLPIGHKSEVDTDAEDSGANKVKIGGIVWNSVLINLVLLPFLPT